MQRTHHAKVRTLVAALASLGLSASPMALAVGLGEAQLESALNQPFKARIALYDVDQLQDKELFIRLASEEVFARAGLERQFFLTQLEFDIQRASPTAPAYVVVSSDNPIQEPFLQFLVELQWPEGRLTREYTFLIDPPGFTPEIRRAENTGVEVTTLTLEQTVAAEAQAIQDAVAQSATEVPTTTSMTRTQAPPPAQDTPKAAASKPKRIYIGAQDTLWSIARVHRPTAAITIKQAMLAIQKANPQAFPNGNINNMVTGFYLDIPDAASMRALSVAEAERQVYQQNQAWVDLQKELLARPKNQAASNPATPPEPQAPASNPMRLSLSGDDQANNNPPVPASNPQQVQRISELEQQLSLSNENLDQAQRERDELASRLASLQEQISTLQRMLKLKDQQLENVNTQLEQAQQAAPTQAALTPPAQPQAAPSEPVRPRAPVTYIPEPIPQEDPLDFLFTSLEEDLELYAGGGAAILALLLGLKVLQRRRQHAAEDQEQEHLAHLDIQHKKGQETAAKKPLASVANQDKTKPQAATEAAPAFEGLNIEGLDSFDANLDALDTLDEAPSKPQPSKTAEQNTAPAPSRGSQRVQQVLSEADMYIAYSRSAQAAELLEQALQEMPEQTSLHLKRLEVLVDLEDEAGFQKAQQALARLGDSQADSRARQLADALAERLAESRASGQAAPVATAAAGLAAFGASQALSQEVLEKDLSKMEEDEATPAPQPPVTDLDQDLGLDDMAELGELDLDLGEAFADLDSLDFDDAPATPAETASSTQAQAPAKSDFDALDDLDLEGSDAFAETSAHHEEELPSTSGLEMDFDAEVEDFPPQNTLAQPKDALDGLDFGEADPFDAAEETNLDTDLGNLDFGELDAASATHVEDHLSEDLGTNLDFDLGDAVPETKETDLADPDPFSLGENLQEEANALGLDLDLSDTNLDDTAFDAGEALLDELDQLEVAAQEKPPASQASEPSPSLTETQAPTGAGNEEKLPELDNLDELDAFGQDMDLSELDNLNLGADLLNFDAAPEEDLESQLELARAYADMGDTEGAREILTLVMEKGDASLVQNAQEVLDKLPKSLG
ncbi:pilus assembly protein FimV [Allopseudospirillum japonicum]|uniref:Pilus assembly protein FimV n=1 Tax=Allopseudospirillum japonicum TaxID=64971 RepID=A0A1H6SXY4_9GAMM|nr:FimV/HubP family polar landmark protein [Allopseudospirillum japonicum]SEI68815.1 pilus assembly protein FimV [Allopseudospirillum japonicum]